MGRLLLLGLLLCLCGDADAMPKESKWIRKRFEKQRLEANSPTLRARTRARAARKPEPGGQELDDEADHEAERHLKKASSALRKVQAVAQRIGMVRCSKKEVERGNVIAVGHGDGLNVEGNARGRDAYYKLEALDPHHRYYWPRWPCFRTWFTTAPIASVSRICGARVNAKFRKHDPHVEKTVSVACFFAWLKDKDTDDIQCSPQDITEGAQKGVHYLGDGAAAAAGGGASSDYNIKVTTAPLATRKQKKAVVVSIPDGTPGATGYADAIFALRRPGDGPAILRGKIFHQKQDVGHFHHSSLFGGHCVQAAGKLTLQWDPALGPGKAVLLGIESDSGHYKPPFASLEHVARWLYQRGEHGAAGQELWCGCQGVLCTDHHTKETSKCAEAFPQAFPNNFCLGYDNTDCDEFSDFAFVDDMDYDSDSDDEDAV